MSVLHRRWERWGIGAFVDEEGGFTTVAVALSLLVSLALVLSLVQIQWVNGRSGDTQAVADATAIAGCQVVRAYSEVAQVLDACVVTLGIAGMVMMGAGLILCFIPFPPVMAAGATLSANGAEVFGVQRDFAESVASGLEKVEGILPYLIYADSFVTAQANRSDVGYIGIAVPFPLEGHSDFGKGDADKVESLTDQIEQANEETLDATKEALAPIEEALQSGWRADCQDNPSCLRERAAKLAGLSDADNPSYENWEDWTFGVALERARAYYRARLAAEDPNAYGTDEERSNSAMRRAYYDYAIGELAKGYYIQGEVPHTDGTVSPYDGISVYLPTLAHDTASIKKTPLWDQWRWPCTQEGDRRVIHAMEQCSGATGEAAGTATLSEIDGVELFSCDVCGLTVGQMGKVAAISYNADNGFEYYWKQIVQASEDFKAAVEEFDGENDRRTEDAEGKADLWDQILDLLAVPRVKLQPPGAWGCISIVFHGEVAPEELENGFTGSAALPMGAAVAGATLAPDENVENDDLFSHIFDSVSQEGDDGFLGGLEGVLEFVVNLWGGLLKLYGSLSDGITDLFDGFFSGLDTFGFGWLGDPIKKKITSATEALGVEKPDLRQKKPVLCNTADIMEKDGNDFTLKVREYIDALEYNSTLDQVLMALGKKALGDVLDREITVGKIEIPFLGFKYEFKINLAEMFDLAEDTS